MFNCLSDAILKNRSKKYIREILHEASSLVEELKYFPETFFDSIIATINNSALHECKKFHYTLYIFNIELTYNYLSEKQREKLISCLEKAYGAFPDAVSCIAGCDIIVELYKNDISLQTLIRLKKTKNEGPRSLIPYGLYYFITRTKNKILKQIAKEELSKMLKDNSQLVVNEVKVSLGKIIL